MPVVADALTSTNEALMQGLARGEIDAETVESLQKMLSGSLAGANTPEAAELMQNLWASQFGPNAAAINNAALNGGGPFSADVGLGGAYGDDEDEDEDEDEDDESDIDHETFMEERRAAWRSRWKKLGVNPFGEDEDDASGEYSEYGSEEGLSLEGEYSDEDEDEAEDEDEDEDDAAAGTKGSVSAPSAAPAAAAASGASPAKGKDKDTDKVDNPE